jgi:hypothetical protein
LEKKAYNKKFDVIKEVKEVDEFPTNKQPKHNSRLMTYNNSPIRKNILSSIEKEKVIYSI